MSKSPFEFMNVNFPDLPEALCAKPGVDPELFFPSKADSQQRASELKPICNACPESVACLKYAIENKVYDGIWAGTSAKERRVIVEGSTSLRQRKGQEPSRKQLNPTALSLPGAAQFLQLLSSPNGSGNLLESQSSSASFGAL